jgi:hypothetical protein
MAHSSLVSRLEVAGERVDLIPQRLAVDIETVARSMARAWRSSGRWSRYLLLGDMDREIGGVAAARNQSLRAPAPSSHLSRHTGNGRLLTPVLEDLVLGGDDRDLLGLLGIGRRPSPPSTSPQTGALPVLFFEGMADDSSIGRSG